MLEKIKLLNFKSFSDFENTTVKSDPFVRIE